MELNKELPKPEKTDDSEFEKLELIVRDPSTGKELFNESVKPKHFSSGSVGYYVGGKFTNPESDERYQVGCNITLIGSKPKK